MLAFLFGPWGKTVTHGRSQVALAQAIPENVIIRAGPWTLLDLLASLDWVYESPLHSDPSQAFS